MYCVKCGVKLADTEKKCPLCNTVVCHPDFKQTAERPLYPSSKLPRSSSGSKAINGAVIILFFILALSFISNIMGANNVRDIHLGGKMKDIRITAL